MKLMNAALLFLLIGAWAGEGNAVQPQPVTVTIQQKGFYSIEVDFYSYTIWARNHNDPNIIARERIDPRPGSHTFLALPYDIDPKSRVRVSYSPTFGMPTPLVDVPITRDTKALQIVCEVFNDTGGTGLPQCYPKK